MKYVLVGMISVIAGYLWAEFLSGLNPIDLILALGSSILVYMGLRKLRK